MHTVIPNQYFGIGDIIFTKTLVRRIANGNRIIWPVLPHFVEGLNRAYPDITFVNFEQIPINYERREQYTTTLKEYGDCTVLPIRFANNILNVPYTECMSSKYALYGMDWREWKEDAMWVRDIDKECELQVRLLNITTGATPKDPIYCDSFSLINRFFRSDMSGCADIPHRGVELCNIDGYSLFDWAMIMQLADSIHTVSTSIIYMLELLKLKSKEVNLYVRKPDEVDFRNIDYILQKHKYVKHV